MRLRILVRISGISLMVVLLVEVSVEWWLSKLVVLAKRGGGSLLNY